MKYILLFLSIISSSFALTEEQIVDLSKKPHDDIALMKELKIFPTAKKISSNITVRIPDIPEQKDKNFTTSKNIKGEFIVRETNIVKEDVNLKLIHVITYSNELKIYKMWTRSLIVYKENDPIAIIVESDGLHLKGSQYITWSQVPDNSNPSHSVVVSHLKPSGEHWISHDYRDGKIVSTIEGVNTVIKK